MPRVTVDGKTVEVSEDKRLVLAIEEAGVEIGHRCGGNARCTTCRVSFDSGEPDTITRPEYDKLRERELLSTHRLSCQIVCSQDMVCHSVMTLQNQGWTDTGPALEPTVTPDAHLFLISELEQEDETET